MVHWLSNYNYAQVTVLLEARQRDTPLPRQTSSEFLTLVHNVWHNHCQTMILIRQIFLYLDRTFVLHTNGVLSIWYVRWSICF